MADKSAIRKLQSESLQLAKRRERIENRVLRLADDERRHQDKIEALILDELRAAGVMRLPLQEILNGVRALGRAGDSKTVDVARTESAGELEAAPTGTGGSQNEEGTEVSVTISRNASAENRKIMEECGLYWNGKRGHWKGTVDLAALRILEDKFVDRLSIVPMPATSRQHHRSGIRDAEQGAADRLYPEATASLTEGQPSAAPPPQPDGTPTIDRETFEETAIFDSGKTAANTDTLAPPASVATESLRTTQSPFRGLPRRPAN
jgi:hypothetical protein